MIEAKPGARRRRVGARPTRQCAARSRRVRTISLRLIAFVTIIAFLNDDRSAVTNSATPSVRDRASDIETEILRLAREEPELGQAAVAERLRHRGLTISASGVRYIWQRHGLETAVKRLQALVREAEEGEATLTEGQRRMLERGTRSAQVARAPSTEDGDAEALLDRRQVILNVAAELFSEQGYDRSSVRDIASRAGLLAGSVYHHFPSKDELYLAVHREGFRRLIEAVRAAVAEETDPWERLRRACEVHVHLIVAGSPVDRVTGSSLALYGNHELLAKIRPARQSYDELFRELVATLPLAPGIDRSILRLMLLGAINWAFIWYRDGGLTPEQIADAMIDIARRGAETR